MPDNSKHLKYYPFIDGFRALAVFGVLLAHGMPLFNLDTPLEAFFGQLFSIGHLGVDMFFVISGFLITGILIEDWGGKMRLSLPRQHFFELML